MAHYANIKSSGVMNVPIVSRQTWRCASQVTLKAGLDAVCVLYPLGLTTMEKSRPRLEMS